MHFETGSNFGNLDLFGSVYAGLGICDPSATALRSQGTGAVLGL